MKNLKLFPKIFLYTQALMLATTLLASGMIYLLAPIISDGAILSEARSGINSPFNPRNTEISNVIFRSLPYSITACVIFSLICAFFFSRAITAPIRHISDTAVRMAALEKNSLCNVHSNDEIGILSKGINELYQNFLSTIDNLKEEKDRVSEAEKQKVDFLRVASHELKTPVTALNAMLENMIMKVGKYRDYETYLPQCMEQTEQLGSMIQEILDTTKLSAAIEKETWQTLNVSDYLSKLCGQYQLIAQAKGQHFKMDISSNLSVSMPPQMFAKALSNVLSNAVAYTAQGKSIEIYIHGRDLIVQNECQPIPEEHLKHIFEAFYRPDYARNREDGGNGLGLYIVASILNALHCNYSFCPMRESLGMRFTINL